MKLSELREHAAEVAAKNQTYHGAIYVGKPAELLEDIQQQLIQSYHNGVKDAESKAKARQSPLHAVGTQPMCKVVETERGTDSYPMRSEDLGDHNPGGWMTSGTVQILPNRWANTRAPGVTWPHKPSDAEVQAAAGSQVLPKVAYSVEESDARLKLLTDKLFSAVQRIELLERGLTENWGQSGSQTREALTARLRALEAARHGETAGYQEQNERIGKLEAVTSEQIPKALDMLRADVGIYREGVAVGVKASGNEALLKRVHAAEVAIEKMEKAQATDYDATQELRQMIGYLQDRAKRLEMSMETCVRNSDLESLQTTAAKQRGSIEELSRRLDSSVLSFSTRPAVIGGVDQLQALAKRLDTAEASIQLLERGEIGPAQLVVNITEELAKHEGRLNELDERTLSLRRTGA